MSLLASQEKNPLNEYKNVLLDSMLLCVLYAKERGEGKGEKKSRKEGFLW